MILCPYCSEKNRFNLLMLGDILDRKLTCRGCAKAFRFNVRWDPKIFTLKDPDYD